MSTKNIIAYIHNEFIGRPGIFVLIYPILRYKGSNLFRAICNKALIENFVPQHFWIDHVSRTRFDAFSKKIIYSDDDDNDTKIYLFLIACTFVLRIMWTIPFKGDLLCYKRRFLVKSDRFQFTFWMPSEFTLIQRTKMLRNLY